MVECGDERLAWKLEWADGREIVVDYGVLIKIGNVDL